MWILDILGSAGFGAITGGIFGWLTKREERANLQMKLDHEVNKIKAQTVATIQIAKMSIEQAKVAGELLVDKIDAEAFAEGQNSTSIWAANVKSMIRPIILGLLMWQSYEIISTLEELTNGLESLSQTEIVGLYRIVVLSVTGLTATGVGWYFSTRSSKQFDKLVDKWKI